MTGAGTKRHRVRPLRLALAALLTILLLIGVVWFLFSTERGAGWVLSTAGAMAPGSLEIGEVAGSLRGPLSVRDLRYRDQGVDVRVDRAALAWRPVALFHRQLDVTSLEIERVRVVTAASEEPSESTVLPDLHLPINIIVRQARMRDFELATADADELQEPITLDSVDLITRAIGDVVEIETFVVRSPQISAEVSGRVEPQGDYPVDLRIEWSARLADQPRWAGAGTLTGTLEDLRVRHRLTAPLTARLDVLLSEPLRDLEFDAKLQAAPFVLATIGLDIPGLAAGGRAHVTGTVENFRGEARLNADYEDYGKATAAVTVQRDDELWRIERLALTRPGTPMRVEAKGELTLVPGAEPHFDIEASWRDLSWPLEGEPVVRSSTGTASMSGGVDDYDLELAGRLLAAPLDPTPIRLVGSGNRRRFDLESGRAELAGGVVTARGEVAWDPRVDWRLAVAGNGLDPSILWPDGDGRLDLDLRTVGHLDDSGVVGRIAPLRLNGRLRGEPVQGEGAIGIAGERLTVRRLDLDWGSLKLTAAGRVAPGWALEAGLEAPDLSLVSADLRGAMSARAQLAGPQNAPHVELAATGSRLGFGALSAAEITVDADVDLSAGGAMTLDAVATEVASGEQRFERVSLSGEGSREQHRLTAAVDGDPTAESPGRLSLAAQGGLNEDNTWHGELTTLDLEVPEAGSWSLAAPATVTASAETVELGRLCEVSNGARLCAHGAWRGADGWQATTELTSLPLALAQPFLPTDLAISGTLGGRIEASATPAGALDAIARFELGGGEVTYPTADGSSDTLRFGPGSLRGAVDDDGTRAALDLPLPDLGQATVELTLPGYRAAAAPGDEQPITATLNAEISDLSFLQAFATQIDDTAGKLTADLNVGGTVGEPRIDGEARLTGGRASVPELAIQLADLSLAAVSQGGNRLRIEGSVRSGDGTLTLGGEVPPAPNAERPIRLTVSGKDFTAMDTREIHLLASPDLELTYDGKLISVDGEVHIPEAEINIRKAPPGSVTASEDVVIVSGEPAADESAMALAMRIRVILGDEIEIAVLGLEGKPTGSLLLIERPGEPTSGAGEIELTEGTFNAYGQDLTIERGRLIFAGPIDDPQIDLRAYREASDGVIAGLEARRSLSRPEITLWSEPSMDQANQLSYILFGRPLGESGPAEEDQLANAALAMGLKRSNPLAGRLASRAGLDEATIDTSDGLDQAALVLGKYLSPRLYVAYGVGLFEAADSLRIRYLLSRRWALEATTGTASGADLLYTIERGR